MKLTKALPIAFAAALMAGVIVMSAVLKKTPVKAEPASATASQAAEKRKAPAEMRGVWVTYMELSMENESDKSEAAFRKKFTEIAENCRDFGFNTLVVQVRPFCDAIYSSKLFPASHILSGEQGKSAGYDALEAVCEICRDRGLSVHAWVNPYRVTANKTPAKLSGNNPCVKDESLVIKTDSGIILDPSSAEARKLIEDGVLEIAKNYDVDGIQFDDYFYPTDMGNQDSARYEKYLSSAPQGSAMDLETWRTFNVSLLISEVYLSLHKSCPGVVFGISPQGNLSNNKGLCADVVSWCCKRGFIDYICPQIYFSLDNPALGFEDALDDWTSLDIAKGVKLYVGLAGYKAGSDADDGTWLDAEDILSREVNILKENNKINGMMLYSYASLLEQAAAKEMRNLKRAIR